MADSWQKRTGLIQRMIHDRLTFSIVVVLIAVRFAEHLLVGTQMASEAILRILAILMGIVSGLGVAGIRLILAGSCDATTSTIEELTSPSVLIEISECWRRLIVHSSGLSSA